MIRLRPAAWSWWLRSRTRRSRPHRVGLMAGAAAIALAAASLAAIGLGSVRVPPLEIPHILGQADHPLRAVMVRVRLPRVGAALCAGAALATAGVLMQTAVRNPLADAGLMGVSAGGGLAAILWLAFVPHAPGGVVLISFVGSFAAAGMLLLVAALAGARATPLVLVLAGVALQSVLFAGIALVTFLFADRTPAFVAFAVGSFAGASAADLVSVVPAVGAGLALAFAGARRFDLLLFDDATAAGLGLAVERTRIAAAGLAALLAAAAVAVAGLVGFVGLLVPNAVRGWIGPRHGPLLGIAALRGAALTVSADLLARTVAAPVELPVGALLALIGGPYFLVLLLRRVAT
jgi:iron complex transport system permease protein